MNANGKIKNNKKSQEQKMRINRNAIKSTVYSSVYVIVAFVEQTIVLQVLRDYISNKIMYFILSLLSIFAMLFISGKIIAREKKKIEVQNNLPETTNNKVVEFATLLGLFSPIFCAIDWYGELIEVFEVTDPCCILVKKILTVGFLLLAMVLTWIGKKKENKNWR